MGKLADKKQAKKNNKNAKKHIDISLDIEEEELLSLEHLFQKYHKNFYESILKKSKNAHDFEWTSINPQHDETKYFIEINDKKKFEFNPKTSEIIWYKNLNIPPIRITKKHSNPPQNEKVSCTAKIMAIRGLKEHSIQQIGLKGETEKRLEKEYCVFNHLKFKETYFQYKKSSFSLVVLIIENIDGKSQISEIKISSPIRVEARKKSYQDRLNTSSLLDPFLPDFIEKQYMVFQQGKRDLVQINDTFEGLLDYLKAQNIRHKPQEIFQSIQIEIYKSLMYDNDNNSTNLDKKIIILCLDNDGSDSIKNKLCEKIIKCMKFLQNSSMFFSSTLVQGLPEYFKQMSFSQEELKQGYKKAYNRMSSQKFEMLISQQRNVQSHLSIQKKGRITLDDKFDKESLDFVNNIPGPFHKSIYDLTIRNEELRSSAEKIKARFEDFDLFSYEIHQNADSNQFGPSLIEDLLLKKNKSDNRSCLRQLNIEKQIGKHSQQVNYSSTTKPSSSDSNNNRNQCQRDNEKGNSDYNNNTSSLINSESSSSQIRCQIKRNNQDEDFKNKNSLQKCDSNHIEFREGELYSSEKEDQSRQNHLNKRKNNKQINFNNQFKKIQNENSKNYLDSYQSKQFKTDVNESPEEKNNYQNDQDEGENFEYDENQEIQIETKNDSKQIQNFNQTNEMNIEQN